MSAFTRKIKRLDKLGLFSIVVSITALVSVSALVWSQHTEANLTNQLMYRDHVEQQLRQDIQALQAEARTNGRKIDALDQQLISHGIIPVTTLPSVPKTSPAPETSATTKPFSSMPPPTTSTTRPSGTTTTTTRPPPTTPTTRPLIPSVTIPTLPLLH